MFLLLIGIPIITEILIMVSIALSKNFLIMFIAFAIMMLYFMVVFFGWFYTLGINLYKKLPNTVNMNLTMFKIALFYPTIYILLFYLFMYGILNQAVSGSSLNPAIFLLIIPLHLFAMFCIFYTLYFNAKSLKSVELQRPVHFSDYAGEFFLIGFFP